MRARLIGLAAAGLLCLAACGRSVPVRYYTLEAPDASPGDARSTRVSVGPLTLPEAVDRPQMVLRLGRNELSVDDLHRWSAPLKRDIPRVLAAQLARRLPEAGFAAASEHAAVDAEYRLLLDIRRFESALGQAAEIDLLWTLKHVSGEIRDGGEIRVREAAAGAGHAALAAAHSRALDRIAEQLAGALHAAVSKSQ